MIHDCTIPFSFDTSPIERQIAAIGEEEVMRIVKEMVRNGVANALPSKFDYGSWNVTKNASDKDIDWKRYVDSYMNSWMERHRQEVVDEAALLMAMRGGRTVRWRDVLAELRAERDEE